MDNNANSNTNPHSGTQDGPLVSIVIPTYYRNKKLRSAIESSLSQTYGYIEVIVVDDSGEDHAKEVAEDFDVVYLSHSQNRGGNPARNTGIKAAEGEYIHLLDDDDQLHPRKLEQCVPVLENNDETGIVYCGYEWGGIEKLPQEEYRGNVLEPLLRDLRLVPCVPSTMLIDAAVLNSIMPLTTRPCKDGLGIRIELAKQTHFDFVDEVLVSRTKSQDSRSDNSEATAETIRIIHEYEDLYSKIGNQFKHQNLSELHTQRCLELLRDSWWSFDAVSSGLTAVQHMVLSRSFSAETVIVAAVSLTGNPGYQIARTAKAKLSKNA